MLTSVFMGIDHEHLILFSYIINYFKRVYNFCFMSEYRGTPGRRKIGRTPILEKTRRMLQEEATHSSHRSLRDTLVTKKTCVLAEPTVWLVDQCGGLQQTAPSMV